MLQEVDSDGQCVLGLAEYIWLAGSSIKSRTRVIEVYKTKDGWTPKLQWLAVPSGAEDILLSPAHYTEDPIRGEQCYLVLCETRDADGRNHETNTRAKLRGTLDAGASDLIPHWTFDQRFRFCSQPGQGNSALGKGRELFELFIQACLQGGLLFGGGRTYKMSGAWSFQIGVRDFDSDENPRWSTQIADNLIFARWMLLRVFEDEDISVVFDAQGFSGMLTADFSTEMMRHSITGRALIQTMAEAVQEGLGTDYRKISTTIPLKTARTGNGPIQVSIDSGSDPYILMNRVLLRVSGMDQQHLAEDDQKRYGNMGLTVLQGGADPEP